MSFLLLASSKYRNIYKRLSLKIDIMRGKQLKLPFEIPDTHHRTLDISKPYGGDFQTAKQKRKEEEYLKRIPEERSMDVMYETHVETLEDVIEPFNTKKRNGVTKRFLNSLDYDTIENVYLALSYTPVSKGLRSLMTDVELISTLDGLGKYIANPKTNKSDEFVYKDFRHEYEADTSRKDAYIEYKLTREEVNSLEFPSILFSYASNGKLGDKINFEDFKKRLSQVPKKYEGEEMSKLLKTPIDYDNLQYHIEDSTSDMTNLEKKRLAYINIIYKSLE